eukprot:Em0179g9a
MDFGGLQMAEDFKGEEAQNISAGREVLAELVAEKESLDQSYVHCKLVGCRMERQTIKTPTKSKLKRFSFLWKIRRRYNSATSAISVTISLQYNLVGRLLGPKGKEEELRNGTDPAYQHLKENLHIVIEATGPHSVAKLAAGVAEEPGAPDPVGSKYQEPGMGGYDAPPLQASPRGGPPPGGRPPRGQGGKVQGREEEGLGSAVRGGRGGVAAAGGSRTPSNVRDYHHQPPVGGPPAGVGYGPEPTQPSHGGYSAPAPHYGHDTYNEGDGYYGSFADTRGDAGYDRRGGGAGNDWKAPRAGEETIVPILTISSSHQHPIFECLFAKVKLPQSHLAYTWHASEDLTLETWLKVCRRN